MMKTSLALTTIGALLLCTFAMPAGEKGEKGEKAAPIRIGIIGLDTSHCVAFTKILHSPKAQGDLAGFRVVAAYPGGSPDIPASKDRIDGFTKELRDKQGVEIVDSIDDLLKKVDV